MKWGAWQRGPRRKPSAGAAACPAREGRRPKGPEGISGAERLADDAAWRVGGAGAESRGGRRDRRLRQGRLLRRGSGQFGHRCHSPPPARLRTADRSNRFRGDSGGRAHAPLKPRQCRSAAAFIRFGRGRHPAALNFGGCMPHAAASTAGMPLSFAGGDFSRTDIAHA